MINKIKRRVKKFIIEREDEIKASIGKQLCFSQKNITPKNIKDIEFKVFSQWGEDGIIEYLINKIPIKNNFFIEFGVEDYNESNTRFLMVNRNWSGCVIDGSIENIQYIKKSNYFWKYDLNPIHKFITKDNINDLIVKELSQLNVTDVGLLSVDIDGIDYCVLREIECISPEIIICEYNAIINNETPLTIPYDENFIRNDSHFSNLYWGANLKAYDVLLSNKGYVYVGSNSQNSNAFFIKKKLVEKYLSKLLVNSDAESSTFRESRDSKGNLNFIRGEGRLSVIKELNLFDLNTNSTKKIKDIFTVQ